MTLAALALTKEAFKPFGAVIAAESLAGIAVNEGRGLRYNTGARLAHATRASEPTLALYRMQPSPVPISVNMFERHPNSAQMFLPMSAARYLVIVAPQLPQGTPDIGAAQAFVSRAERGVIYSPGVWHAPLMALDAASTFAMMMFENGDAQDCVTHQLNAPLLVSL
jgi:ureidoglycolate lyase